jgi:hypothetical protein
MATYAISNLVKAAAGGIWDIANVISGNTLPKNEVVLDPLTTLIRLSLLPYKAENTKISVRNGSIEFDEPQLQASVRTLKRSARSALKELKPAIESATKLYNKRNVHIQYIFRKAIEGLRCLLHVYNPHKIRNPENVCNSIEWYIECLERSLQLNNTTTSYAYTNNLISNNNNNILEGDSKIVSSIPYSHTFSALWSPQMVQAVYLMLLELNDTAQQHSNTVQPTIGNLHQTSYSSLLALVQAINIILDSKDELIKMQLDSCYAPSVITATALATNSTANNALLTNGTLNDAGNPTNPPLQV